MKQFIRFLIGVFLSVVAMVAGAVPATVNVTATSLTEDGSGGAPDGYRLHRGCDLAAQTVGPLIADPAVVGTGYSFAGDTDNVYVVCAVAFNAAGIGGFANTVTLSFDNVVIPPGSATVILSCDVQPSGAIANCVQTNNP